MDPHDVSKHPPSPKFPTYGSHQRQTVPLAEEVDVPPSYEDSQVHTAASSSSAGALTPPSRSHITSSVSSNADEHTPLHSIPINSTPAIPATRASSLPMRVSTEAYRSPNPMTAAPSPQDWDAKRRELEDKPGCCFSTTGGCCFSSYGGCCFSSNGACCFSDHAACCFSDNEACCCSNNQGCFFSDGATGGSCCSGRKY